MTCPQCGAPQRDDARFCGKCGAQAASTEPASSPSLGEAPAMIGREIAGRYRMLAKLGEGGMGAVYRAEQISLKRTVAVKLLRPEVLGNQLLLRRFNAEAEAVAKLNHPNTVNIYDFGQDSDGALFIAMEFIEGRSLRAVIQAEAPLPPRRALAIALQVAASLSDAHAHSVVHRDLKPDNVMLQDRGRERDVARVLDFGIAKLRDDNRATQMAMTQQGDMLGTPQYMAPEQIRAETIDGRTDVYALGCLLYEMVTGRLPHEATTVLALLSKHLLEHPVPPSQRRPELGLPPALDHLILAAMAKDPRARPPTMDAFSEQLAALLPVLPPDPHSAPRSAQGPAAPGPITGVPPGPSSGPPGVPSSTPAAYSASSPHGSPYGPSPYPSPYPPPSSPYAAPSAGYTPPSAAYAPPSSAYPPSAYPPLAPGPPGPPPPFAAAPPPSRKVAALAIAGMVVVGGGIAALIIADRTGGDGPTPTPSDAAVVRADAHSELDEIIDNDDDGDDDDGDGDDGHGDDGPAKLPTSDPWGGAAAPPVNDQWAASGPPEGEKLAVGQGVSIIFPPGFRTVKQKSITVGVDDRGATIIAGPITSSSNDPQQLAREHARTNHLKFESMQSIFVGGVQRPMAIFHGHYGSVAIRHVAVPLIGRRYRIAVMFQAPAQAMVSDASIQALALELYTRRIVLP